MNVFQKLTWLLLNQLHKMFCPSFNIIWYRRHLHLPISVVIGTYTLLYNLGFWKGKQLELSNGLTVSVASDMKPIRLFHTLSMSLSNCCSFSLHTAVAFIPSSTRLVTLYTSTTPDRVREERARVLEVYWEQYCLLLPELEIRTISGQRWMNYLLGPTISQCFSITDW